MATRHDGTEYHAQAFSEYITGAIDTLSPDTTLYGKAATIFHAYVRSVLALNEIYEIQTNDNYPQEIKDAVSVMVIGYTFGGATPGASIPMTFQAAWEAVNDVPDQFGGGTKEEFWQALTDFRQPFKKWTFALNDYF
jgi:hypothetical protein